MSESAKDKTIVAAVAPSGDAARLRGSKERPSQVAYFAEHGAALGFPDPLESGKAIYDFNLTNARNRLQFDGLMSNLTAFLVELASDYAGGRPELLYYPAKPSDLQLLAKPYASMLTKVYRINCLHNLAYPAPPRRGLIEHATIYSHVQMNDLLRTRLICKYMDGPKFVAEALARFCASRELEFRSYPMHSDTGYHAWHCYIRNPIDIAIGGDVESREMWMELQVTTQLAEIITVLTHGLYETSRVRSPASSGDEWRWDPRTQRFRSAYLGHTLHLLEGIIQTFRDDVLGIEPDAAESDASKSMLEHAPPTSAAESGAPAPAAASGGEEGTS